MRSYLLVVFFVLINSVSFGQGLKVELWGIEQLQEFIKSEDTDKKLKVINFWATWCAPCIKELPYFEELSATNKNNVEVLLVSLDFSDELEKKVIPFLKRKKIKARVVILANEKYNEWMDKVDASWSGAIPATLFITSDGVHHFYEMEFDRKELYSIVGKLETKTE